MVRRGRWVGDLVASCPVGVREALGLRGGVVVQGNTKTGDFEVRLVSRAIQRQGTFEVRLVLRRFVAMTSTNTGVLELLSSPTVGH